MIEGPAPKRILQCLYRRPTLNKLRLTRRDWLTTAAALGTTTALSSRLPLSHGADESTLPGKTVVPELVVDVDVNDEVWLREHWSALLKAIRPRSRSVEALLNSCEHVSVQGDLVTLGFHHGFHKERMDEEKSRCVVEEALAEIAGRTYRVKSTLYKGSRRQTHQQAEEERRARLLNNPVVSEAIKRYGARVVDVG